MTAAQVLRERKQTRDASVLEDQMTSDFTTMLDTWHASPEVYDDELDEQIHRWYADYLADKSRKVWPPRDIPYFTPSSASDCRRALYEKMLGAKRDKLSIQPHQGRWTRFGTSIADSIQRDLLFIEKHYEEVTGQEARFRFERNDLGEPMFEEFAKGGVVVRPSGKRFTLFGTCDGIMRYQAVNGRVLRVGLEIKSKQTTAARTSHYSLREPDSSHVKQCIAYSIMYGVNDYIILYVNAAKNGWVMSDEEYAKTPDIRAFHIHITERDKQVLLDEFVDVIQAVEDGNPPTLDPEKWIFNSYKTAVARSLSGEEFTQLEHKVAQVRRSNMTNTKKRDYARCLDDIRRLRGEGIA